MKYLIILSTIFVGLSGCKDDAPVEDTPKLSEQEKSDLQFLREEEKLARDVYLYAYSKYQVSTFNNISSSEQRHMDEVLKLLNYYNVIDPVGNNGEGEFTNLELQQLYESLTDLSDSSLIQALHVGATIEDLDIHDIESFNANTDKSDILAVYSKLTCGSRNHMRAYYGKLLDEGETYKAQYISQDDLDQIINGSHENCGQ